MGCHIYPALWCCQHSGISNFNSADALRLTGFASTVLDEASRMLLHSVPVLHHPHICAIIVRDPLNYTTAATLFQDAARRPVR